MLEKGSSTSAANPLSSTLTRASTSSCSDSLLVEMSLSTSLELSLKYEPASEPLHSTHQSTPAKQCLPKNQDVVDALAPHPACGMASLPAARSLLGDITNSPLKSAQERAPAAKASPFRPPFVVAGLTTPRASPSTARARKSARKALLPQRPSATPKKQATGEPATPQRARTGLAATPQRATEQEGAASELVGVSTPTGALQAAATPVSGRRAGSGRRGHASPSGVVGWRAPKSPGLARVPLSPGDSSCGGVRKPPNPFSFFLFTLVTGPRRSLSLKLSDTRVYEPQIRARLGTTAHFCEVAVLKLRAVPV